MDFGLGGNMKKSLLPHLKRYWAIYVCSGVAVTMAFLLSGTYLGKTKEEEKVDILLVADSYDNKKWESFLSSIKLSYLKEVNYRYLSSADSMLPSVLSTFGEVEADLFFFPEDVLKTVKCSSLMLPLNEDKAKSAFGDGVNFYEDEGVKYGVKISTQDCFNAESAFYACFRSSSLHLGELTNSSLGGDVEIVRAFL